MTNDDGAGRVSDGSLDADDLIELYGLSEADRQRIAEFGANVHESLPDLVEQFYVWLRPQPWFAEYFTDDEILARVQDLQSEYWKDFFTAEVNDEYVWRRRVIGQTHARIGLPLTAYFVGVSVFQRGLLSLIREQEIPDADVGSLIESIDRLIALDAAVVVDTYNRIVEETLTEQADSLLAMSTPVTEIWDGVLFLPIVGLIDSHRAQEVMNGTLAKISESQAQVFILDISGVGVVDTAVANNLFRITKATKLMGCESIISGVSPAIAQTIVDLGIDVGRIRTTATMRDALAASFQRVGLEITQKE